MRPSTSTIFRNYEQQFKRDTTQLEKAIEQLKAEKVGCVFFEVFAVFI